MDKQRAPCKKELLSVWLMATAYYCSQSWTKFKYSYCKILENYSPPIWKLWVNVTKLLLQDQQFYFNRWDTSSYLIMIHCRCGRRRISITVLNELMMIPIWVVSSHRQKILSPLVSPIDNADSPCQFFGVSTYPNLDTALTIPCRSVGENLLDCDD